MADSSQTAAIERANDNQALRSRTAYADVASKLAADTKRYSGDAYALARVQNELADLHTYQHIDIERAIELDRRLSSAAIPDATGKSDFVPSARAAGNRIMGADEYVKTYVTVSGSEIRKRAGERLARNEMLVKGELPRLQGRFTAAELNANLVATAADLERAQSGSALHKTLLSRLVRTDHEIGKIQSGYKYVAVARLQGKPLVPADFDLAEIDFLSLADYFSRAHAQTADVAFARLALETVYVPYTNLRDPTSRWSYNKLINGYISTLIKAHMQAGRHEDMLYYIALNKSRMLLEERIAVTRSASSSQTIAEAAGEQFGRQSGAALPDRRDFAGRLAKASAFLDFYVDGNFTAAATASASAEPKANRSAMLPNARAYGVQGGRSGGLPPGKWRAFLIE